MLEAGQAGSHGSALQTPEPAAPEPAPSGAPRAHREPPVPASPTTSAPPETTVPAAPDPPEPGPAGAGADTPLVELRRRWPEIVALISRHPPTKPLIEACRPLAAEGTVVTLGFPESQLFLRDVADRRRPTLEEGISRVLGRPVVVRCVATNLEADLASTADPEASAVIAAARAVWGDELVGVIEVD